MVATGRESTSESGSKARDLARRACGLRGCRVCRPASANRAIAHLSFVAGSGGKVPYAPTPTKDESLQGKVPRRSPSMAHHQMPYSWAQGYDFAALLSYLVSLCSNGGRRTLVRLAVGLKYPASQSPRASGGRPGSGIQAQRLQLARGSARAPARCQRGADVGALDGSAIAEPGCGRALHGSQGERGTCKVLFSLPPSVRPS